MLRFLHPNKFWLFPVIVRNSVLPRLRLASNQLEVDLLQENLQQTRMPEVTKEAMGYTN